MQFDFLLFSTVQVQASVATSHYSGRIFQKIGFTEARSVEYRSYEVDNKVVFPTEDPHDKAVYYVNVVK